MCSGIGTLLSTSSESRVRSDEGALDEDEAGVFQTTCTVTTPKRVLGERARVPAAFGYSCRRLGFLPGACSRHLRYDAGRRNDRDVRGE